MTDMPIDLPTLRLMRRGHDLATPPGATLLAGRYALADGHVLDPAATVLVDGTDVLLNRPVTVLALPATTARFRRFRQCRTAARFPGGGTGLVDVRDVVDDGRRVHLVLPAGYGELLGERLRRGPLPRHAAARIAADVLAARARLREQGSPGAAAIDPYGVVVGAENAARLVPLPCDGVPGGDDVGPVRELFATMTGGEESLRDAGTADALRAALDRLASPQAAPDAPTTGPVPADPDGRGEPAGCETVEVGGPGRSPEGWDGPGPAGRGEPGGAFEPWGGPAGSAAAGGFPTDPSWDGPGVAGSGGFPPDPAWGGPEPAGFGGSGGFPTDPSWDGPGVAGSGGFPADPAWGGPEPGGFGEPGEFRGPADEGWSGPTVPGFDRPAGFPPPVDAPWDGSATVRVNAPGLPGYPSDNRLGDTAGRSRPRTRTVLLVLVTALNLLLAGATAAVWLHTQSTPAPAPAPIPIPIPAPAPRPAPPTTVPGLLAAVTANPPAAGVDSALLRDDLAAVASSTGEARRQNALRVLTLAGSGHLVPEYAHAATTAVTPFTVLNAPVDVIADLSPDPAAAGPNAHFVLNCMLEFQGKPQAVQRAEATELLEKIQGWAQGGGIRADLVTAVIRIVTPVAQGTETFTDAQTGFHPGKPQPPAAPADGT